MAQWIECWLANPGVSPLPFKTKAGVGSRVGSGDGWGGGKMETTVLEQQFKKCEKKKFPATAHAWVAGSVPSRGCVRGNQTMFHPDVSLFLPSPLSKNK